MKYLNEKGNALFLTIVAVVFVTLIGINLLKVTANSNKTTVNERYDQSIYYIAEAGINLEKISLQNAIKLSYDKAKQSLTDNPVVGNPSNQFSQKFEEFFCLDNPQYCDPNAFNSYDHYQTQFNNKPQSLTTVSMSCLPLINVECTFSISSKGFFKNQPAKTRELHQSLTVTLPILTSSQGGDNSTTPGSGNGTTPPTPFKDMAAVSGCTLSVGGSGYVKGNVGTLANCNGNGKGNGNGNGNGNGKGNGNSNGNYLNTTPYKNNPNNPSGLNGLGQTITENIDLKKFLPTIPSTNNLNLENAISSYNIGNQDVTFYVRDLNTSKNIEFIGSGKVTIIVKDTINLKGSITRKDGKHENLNIFYLGPNGVTLDGSTTIGGSINIVNSSVTFGGGKIGGNIYYHGDSQLFINGNSQTSANYLVAPKASIKSNGNAKFTGMILAENIDITGNFSLFYSSDMLVPLPNTPQPTPPTTPPTFVGGRDIGLLESDLEEK